MDQAALAVRVVENLNMDYDAKQGILEAITRISSTFSLRGLNGPWASGIGDISASLTILGMFIGMSGVAQQPSEAPEEVDDLIAEIGEIIRIFENQEFDPDVRLVARRHMMILQSLLRHIPIFGIEAALSVYFEMMLKVRRADVGSGTASAEQTKSAWETMKTWGERLTSIEKIYTVGAKLVGKANDVGLLTYIHSVT